MSREPRLGAGRISAALLGAPVAALLAAVALSTGVPADGEVRLLVGELAAFPLVIAASSAALLSRSGRRAWLGSALAALAAAVVVALTR
jgi:hypothetical protein